MDPQIRPRKPEPVTRSLNVQGQLVLRRQVASWLGAPIQAGQAIFTDAAHAERFDRIVKAHTE
jgi:hypothetical protein